MIDAVNLAFYKSTIVPELGIFFALIMVCFLITGLVLTKNSKKFWTTWFFGMLFSGLILLIFMFLPDTIISLIQSVK